MREREMILLHGNMKCASRQLACMCCCVQDLKAVDVDVEEDKALHVGNRQLIAKLQELEDFMDDSYHSSAPTLAEESSANDTVCSLPHGAPIRFCASREELSEGCNCALLPLRVPLNVAEYILCLPGCFRAGGHPWGACSPAAA